MSSADVIECRKSRILYVEDEALLRDLFETVMTEKGFDVELAKTGAAALDMHQGTPYDIVAIDYMLEDMTGLDLARALLDQTPELAVIFITGKGSEQVASAALNLGVMHYVIKEGDFTYTDWIPKLVTHLDGVCRERLERRELEKTVRNDEVRRRAFTSNAPEAIFIKNIDGTYQFVNTTFEKNYQVSTSQIIGKTSAVIFSPAQVALEEAQDKLVLQTGDVNKMELRLEGKDGDSRYLLIRKFPILDDDGEIAALGGIHVDVTVQKQSQRALAQTAAIFNGSADGIILINEAGIIETANPAATRIFGYEAEEIIGQDVSCLLPEEERVAHQGYIATSVLHMPRIINKNRELVKQCANRA